MKNISLHSIILIAIIMLGFNSSYCQEFYSETIDTVSGPSVAGRKIMHENAGKDRPTVGLVLSGGGAKGIAHIGVIKALEENDIPIDCLTGTSMGAVVGGLYSCGYSPEEMMELITSKEFLNCSSGTIDPDLTYYFSRPEPTPQWASVSLTFKPDSTNSVGGQIIPASLINPLPMNIEFLKLFSKYTTQCGGDFNHLFVPFRCVTSDVYNKHKVVLAEGSVANAVRASMSFPAVYRPIEINGMLMFDGGIYDNFPVDVMQEEFDPDFVIGVSVSGPDGRPEPGNLFSQLEDMIIQNNNYEVPREAGVKIQVPVLDFGVLAFDQAKTIYDIGYKTGLAMVDSIKSRTTARISAEEITQRRGAFAAAAPVIEFDSISVTGARPGQARFLKFLFTKGKPERPFGMAQTEDAFYRAISGGKLNDLLPFALLDTTFKVKKSPSLEENVSRHNTLLLQSRVKNPWTVGVGGWVTTTTQSMLYLRLGFHTLSYNSLDLDLSGWVGQSYCAAMLQGKFSIHTQAPSYMKLQAVVSRQKFYDSQLMFYKDTTPAFITESESYLKMSYCVATGRKSVASASLGYAWQADKYFPGVEDPNDGSGKDKSRYHTAALKLEWEYNTLDNVQFPMAGRELKFGVIGENIHTQFLPENDKTRATPFTNHWQGSAEVSWREFFPIFRRVKLGVSAQGVVTLSKLYQDYTPTMIRAYAYAPTPSVRNYYNPAFRSDNFVAAGLMPIWNPFDKLQIRGDFYGFLPIRDIKAGADGKAEWDGWCKHPQFIGQISAVYNFSFASLTLYGNYLSNPKSNWNFGISFGLYFQAPRFR